MEDLMLFEAGWYSECKVNDEEALWLESTDENWNPEESDTVSSKIKWYSKEEINKQDCTIVI